MEIEANLIFIQYSISIYINLYLLPLFCAELSVKTILDIFHLLYILNLSH